MSFSDRLKEFLRAVERGDSPPIRESRSRSGLAAARRHFLEALERLERQGQPGEELCEPRGVSLDDWQDDWLDSDEFETFVTLAENALRGGLCAGDSPDIVRLNLCRVMDAVLELEPSGISKVRAREIARIANESYESANRALRGMDVSAYAFENRLTRKVGTLVEVSPIGRVLLGLPKMDSVQWLLTVETLQWSGPDDDDHVSLNLLGSVLKALDVSFSEWHRHHGHGVDEDPETGEPIFAWQQWPYTASGFRHLIDLGIVEKWRSEDGEIWGYSLDDAYRPLLEDIVTQKRTPLSLLAETLLADERDAVSGHAVALVPPRESGAVLQARHARMVTHEIRNVIVPMRMALSGLSPEHDGRVAAAQWQSTRDRIDRGIDRLFRFVGDLEQVARLGAPPSAPFDLAEAIRDAITGLNGGLGLTVQYEVDEGVSSVTGDRGRFTMVIVNLLRNAAQNHSGLDPRVRIRVTYSTTGDRTVVAVDDNGAGVPEAFREQIFRQGFALRAGGSGQGLALVREVVEGEMRGQVRCVPSDLGGASFVLEVPSTAKETP